MEFLRLKKIFPAAFILIFTYGCVYFGGYTFISHRDLDDILKRGTLKVVTDVNPVNYYIENSQTGGLQYDLITLFAENYHLKVEFLISNSPQKSLNMLETNRADIAASLLFPDKRLREKFSFTKPFYRSPQVLIQNGAYANAKGVIHNTLDLTGITIEVPRQSPYVQRIKNLSEELGDTINLIENPKMGTEQLVIKVAYGEIEATVAEKNIAEEYKRRFPVLNTDLEISFEQNRSWAINKENKILLKAVNKWIDELKSSGELEILLKKHFKTQGR